MAYEYKATNKNVVENTNDYVTNLASLADPEFGTVAGAQEYDGNTSNANVLNDNVEPAKEIFGSNAYQDTRLTSLFHSNHLYSQGEIKNALYSNTFRFGFISPSDTLSVGREYLFFTKPDLNILRQDDKGAVVKPYQLTPGIASMPFWQDMFAHRLRTISCLEESYHLYPNDKFNHLLQNMVISNLEIPALSAEVVDTPTNMYGVGFSYRGSSEASDDNPTFSLEFKDTKYLDVYHYFKAYEEYETAKHHGVIGPSKWYTVNKILHDQFSIYKFILDEDMETIIYYGKMYGVMPVSLPRDVFSNPNFDSGISYSIDFKAAFYEDMKPEILSDFNKLSGPLYKNTKYKLSAYNPYLDRTDNRLAKTAYIVKDTDSRRAKMSTAGYIYKLKWKGDMQQ